MENRKKFRHKGFMQRSVWFAKSSFIADILQESTVRMNARKEIIT